MFEDLVVIELANVLAGPSVGMFLAELGARVIKVENLRAGGDITRSWHLSSESQQSDCPAYFCAINWGKESIALDLKSPEGKKIVYQLVQQADIVISSYIPGTAERLGVDAKTLRQYNPQIICAEINGYGTHESRAAFDAIIQAEAGFTFLNGEKGKGLSKMPVALMDVLAGHQLKEAILIALIKRFKTGKGSTVSVSLIASALASLANQATNWLVAGHEPQPMGSEHPNIVPYGSVFYTSDQLAVVIAIGNDRQFKALCSVLQLAEDPRFETNALRIKHKSVLLALLGEKFATWKREPLLKMCLEQKIPVGAVNSISEAMALPQADELMLEQGNRKGVKSFVGEEVESAKKISILPPPHFGEHSEKILSSFLSLSKEEIELLISNNVVG